MSDYGPQSRKFLLSRKFALSPCILKGACAHHVYLNFYDFFTGTNGNSSEINIYYCYRSRFLPVSNFRIVCVTRKLYHIFVPLYWTVLKIKVVWRICILMYKVRIFSPISKRNRRIMLFVC